MKQLHVGAQNACTVHKGGPCLEGQVGDSSRQQEQARQESPTMPSVTAENMAQVYSALMDLFLGNPRLCYLNSISGSWSVDSSGGESWVLF